MRAVLGMVALEHEGKTIRTDLVANCLPFGFDSDETFYHYTLAEHAKEFERVDTEYGMAVRHLPTGVLIIPRVFAIVKEVPNE